MEEATAPIGADAASIGAAQIDSTVKEAHFVASSAVVRLPAPSITFSR